MLRIFRNSRKRTYHDRPSSKRKREHENGLVCTYKHHKRELADPRRKQKTSQCPARKSLFARRKTQAKARSKSAEQIVSCSERGRIPTHFNLGQLALT